MPQEQPTNDNEMKQQAIRRVLIAIALIMVAIVVLNALSRLKESQQKVLTTTKEPSVASAAVAPITPSKEIIASVIEKPASVATVAEPVASIPSEPVAASHPAPPVVSNSNGYVAPSSSSTPEKRIVTTVDNLPGTPLALPAKPTTKPMTAPIKPITSSPTVIAPVIVVPEKTAKTLTAPAAPLSAATPKAPTTSNAPTISVQSYTVQAGVFGQYENANTLYQKLKDQGIPVRLESRVVVGPFKDKGAATAALRELESLGIKPVVIPNVVNSK